MFAKKTTACRTSSRLLALSVVMVMGVSGIGLIQYHVKFNTLHTGAGIPVYLQFVITDGNGFQLLAQKRFVQSKVQHGAKKHVPADTAKNVEI